MPLGLSCSSNNTSHAIRLHHRETLDDDVAGPVHEYKMLGVAVDETCVRPSPRPATFDHSVALADVKYRMRSLDKVCS